MNAFYEHRDEHLFIGEMTHYPFPVHVHELAEIVTVTAGTALISINETEYRLVPGDVAVIFPLTPHGYIEISEDASGLVAIFPPDIVPEYNSTFHSLEPDLPVLLSGENSPDALSVIQRLHALNMEENLPLCIAYLHVLLACTLHHLSYHPIYNYSDRGLGYRIMQYISDHACEEITLESASHALGISASHLSHFFSEKMHINFRQHINSLRIEKARLLMRDPDYTLTMISDACGFTNMRTFRRAFAKETGRLPSEHLAAQRNRIREAAASAVF
ncbi:MAG: helix-turn-helix domain-containing protein [Clostridia bacterium]|nr:helix-turn-helix domain-containing protein [Clostridia bacterium]